MLGRKRNSTSNSRNETIIDMTTRKTDISVGVNIVAHIVGMVLAFALYAFVLYALMMWCGNGGKLVALFIMCLTMSIIFNH